MAADRINPVIRFEPDGYVVKRDWLMGRHVAGAGFLRAAVEGRGPGPVSCYTPRRPAAEAFAQVVREIDPTAEPRWIPAGRLADIGGAGGVLYLGDPTLPRFAEARLRAGPAAYSICGVTHTTCTAGTMQTIADLLSAPVTPWDALVCTSSAVLETVRRVHEAEAEALRWRLGPEVRIAAPQLPVIPLGVHCDEFAIEDGERAAAREALGLAEDEVVVLFVGRLTFSGKHHPFPIYHALQAAAERTGRRLVFLQCGWASTAAIREAFETAPAQFAPDVRCLVVEGRDPELRRQAWAAGHIFISLADGIQETFGLTPIEAMAAGLPCVVSDWDGYKDTVRDEVDGFRIPTYAPAPGQAGETFAREYELEQSDYDTYLWHAAAATFVDMAALTERLIALIGDPALRRRLGEAARRRAREVFDWPVVLGRYQELWRALAERREAALRDPAEAAWLAAAPKAGAARLDPFHAFGHYPTHLLDREVVLRLAPGADLAAYQQRRGHPMFGLVRLPDPLARALLGQLVEGPLAATEAAARVGLAVEPVVYAAAVLAKMGLVEMDVPPGG